MSPWDGSVGLSEWAAVSGLGSLLIGTAAWTADRFLRRSAPRAAAALWWCALARLVAPPSFSVGGGWLLEVAPGAVAQGALQAPPSPPPPLTVTDLGPWAAAWLAVAALLTARMLLGLIGAHRAWHRTPLEQPAPGTLSAYGACAAALGLRVPPPLRVSDHLGPACVGLFRLQIVLPRTLETQSERAHLEAALLHELGHAQRRDGIRRLLVRALRIAFWFHPVTWIAERRLHALAELDCDRRASLAVSGGPKAYRTSLLQFAAAATGGPVLAATYSSAWAPRRGELMQRLTALAEPMRPWRQAPRWAAAFALLGTSALGVGMDAASAGTPTTQSMAAAGSRGATHPLVLPTSVPIEDLEGCLQKRYAVMAALADR